MSMKPKEITTEHQKRFERIGDGCKKAAKLVELSDFTGAVLQFKNALSDLHNDIVKGETDG